MFVWHAQMEANAGFLRAARAGTLDKVVECLDHNGADINACNPVCVINCTLYWLYGLLNTRATVRSP